MKIRPEGGRMKFFSSILLKGISRSEAKGISSAYLRYKVLPC